MKDNRSNLVQEVSDQINKFFGKYVLKTSIPRNVRLAEAPSFGETILTYDPKCKGAFAYMLLAEEVLERNNDTYEKLTKIKR